MSKAVKYVLERFIIREEVVVEGRKIGRVDCNRVTDTVSELWSIESIIHEWQYHSHIDSGVECQGPL